MEPACVPQGASSLKTSEDWTTSQHMPRSRLRPLPKWDTVVPVPRSQLKTEFAAALTMMKGMEALERSGRIKSLAKGGPSKLTDPLTMARCHSVMQVSYRRMKPESYELDMFHVDPEARMRRDHVSECREAMFKEWNAFGRPRRDPGRGPGTRAWR
jgi:hypothetical protein